MKHKPNCDLIPPGVYPGVVASAMESVSKKGNEMIELFVEVWDSAGESFSIQDYLIAMPKMEWKTRSFCRSAGIDYDKGDLRADEIQGKNVVVKIGTQDSAEYGMQTKILDYVSNGASAQPVKAAKVKPADNDPDLPF